MLLFVPVAGSDSELFAAWCGGDRAAGQTLFDRHYAGIARYFHNKVDDAVQADLIQATFLACTEARERFRGEGSFRTFLFSIAHNLLCKHYRDRKVSEPIDLSRTAAADFAPTASAVVAAREEQRILLQALRRIPIECQEVLELHYWEQLTTAEIADVVDTPAGTVKSRLQRGRRLLEEQLALLAHSPAVLESTLSGLDDWARDLRDRVLQSDSSAVRL